MSHDRRDDWSGPAPERRGGNRRYLARRRGTRAGLDRRGKDRRRLAQGMAGVLLAGATFGAGALRAVERPRGEPAMTGAVSASELGRAVAEAATIPAGLELPTYLNGAVESAMEHYSGQQNRRGFAQALARGDRYLEDIRQVFVEEGVPPDLAYVALVESEFQPKAQSGARARGVWQIMPHTGKALGLQQDFWVDERSDPVKSTRAAAQYLRYLHDKFGDWDLALAAYNAGEGNVSRAIRRQGTDDFWRLAQSGALPRETREYVPRIRAAILLARNPEKYGLEVRREEVPETRAVRMPEGTDLRAVAECTGVALDEVMGLNPALRQRATPLNRTMEIQLPAGVAGEAQRCIVQLPPEQRSAFQKHTVASGQTVGGLARKYKTRASDIMEANDLRSATRIAKGTELVIPKAGVLAD